MPDHWHVTMVSMPAPQTYRSLSYWLSSVPGELAPAVPLPGDLDVDVAIVGAGFTGLWTAYYLATAQPDLRIAVLGPEYNLTPHHLVFSCAEVRIIHGRGRANLASLQRRFNAKLGNRVYVPRLDAVIHDDMLAPELRHLWWMTTLQVVRKAGRWLTPLWLRDRLRRSALVRRLFLRNRFTETTAANDPKWHEPGSPAK